jgi:hypothetical protein
VCHHPGALLEIVHQLAVDSGAGQIANGVAESASGAVGGTALTGADGGRDLIELRAQATCLVG